MTHPSTRSTEAESRGSSRLVSFTGSCSTFSATPRVKTSACSNWVSFIRCRASWCRTSWQIAARCWYLRRTSRTWKLRSRRSLTIRAVAPDFRQTDGPRAPRGRAVPLADPASPRAVPAGVRAGACLPQSRTKRSERPRARTTARLPLRGDRGCPTRRGRRAGTKPGADRRSRLPDARRRSHRRQVCDRLGGRRRGRSGPGRDR